jgi:hypothetical protein
MFARDTLTILHLLKDHGIDAIPLKGALASGIIFNDPALYIAGDIDILVKPSQLDGAKKIFLDNNYYQYAAKNEKAMLSSHYHLDFQNERHTVEVHWNLVKRYFRIPPEFWWKDTLTAKYDENEFLCLSTERYIMYLIFRLFSHQFFPLKFYVLTSELINLNHKYINWDNLLILSSRFRMKRLTIFTLLLLNELLNTKIPVSILKSRIPGYNFLKKSVLSELFRESKRPYYRKFFYVFLLDTPLDILKVLFKRVFPEKGEMRLRYGIPEDSLKIYMYYLLNPILLPFLLLRKRI